MRLLTARVLLSTVPAMVLSAGVMAGSNQAGVAAAAATAPGLAASPLKFGHGVLRLVSRAGYAALADQVCAVDGLGFSPYARNLDRLAVRRLTRQSLKDFVASRQAMDWGRYDGSGEPILLTPMAYHRQFVYDVDYLSKGRPVHLSVEQVAAQTGLSAVAAAYPAADLVLYRFAGSRAAQFKDARELLLILNRAQGRWCLEAIAHSEDTV